MKIGIAGVRGLFSMNAFNEMEDVTVAALCDLDEDLLNKKAAEHNISKKYRVFEDMLESDIDGVLIATPMQCHVPQAIAALQAGKHVLSEVTAGVTMDELWWLIETVEKSGKIYMMSENYCYTPENQLIRQLCKEGFFGEVYYGEGEYLHDLRDIIRDKNGKPTWRSFWQVGKRGSFYPTHSIGPLMQWFEGDSIQEVVTFGSGRHIDLDLRQEDTTVTMCVLDSGKLLRIRVDALSPRPHNMSYYQLQGTKGVYEAPRGLGDGHKIALGTKDDPNGFSQWRPLEDFMLHLPEKYKKPGGDQAGHGGGDYFVIREFADSVKNNTQPDIDVYRACEWTAVALLSEISASNSSRAMKMPKFRKNMPYEEKGIIL